MNLLSELIERLNDIKDEHGNIPIAHNELKLEVTGISYKYLIVYSNYMKEKKGKKDEKTTEV